MCRILAAHQKSLNLRRFSSRAYDVNIGTLAEDEIDRVNKDRFACACLA